MNAENPEYNPTEAKEDNYDFDSMSDNELTELVLKSTDAGVPNPIDSINDERLEALRDEIQKRLDPDMETYKRLNELGRAIEYIRTGHMSARYAKKVQDKFREKNS
jgi:hypothetical protein